MSWTQENFSHDRSIESMPASRVIRPVFEFKGTAECVEHGRHAIQMYQEPLTGVCEAHCEECGRTASIGHKAGHNVLDGEPWKGWRN